MFCNDINAELLDLRRRSDICERRVHELVTDDNLANRVEKNLLDVIKTQTSQLNIYSFRTKCNGTVTWLNGITPDIDEYGSTRGVYGFGVLLEKNGKSYINNCLSEHGVPYHLLNLVNIDSDFQHPQLALLTKTERKVLVHLLSGYSYKGISQKLYISPRTVETHLNNIKNKFFVNSRDQLVEFCHEVGLTQILYLGAAQ